MAITHGRRAYYQILLDPYRAKLVEAEAEKQGMRPTALIREMVYKALERGLPSSVYSEAVAQDEASWRASVRRRVEGRKKTTETNKNPEEPQS